MNKKFSTLLVGALLTSSVGAFATSTIRTVGHNIDLRPNETMSVAPTKTITKFENKLYQLSDGNGNVLVQERNLTTGELTMKLVAAADAPINASLWTITAIEDARSGYIFNYVNKETNMPLSIDVAKTLKATAVQATADLASANASVVEGCLENWAWYTTDDNGTTAFPVSKVYSYFTADSIAVLQKKDDGTIVTVKYSKAVAGTNASSVTDAITIQPVEAAAIVLTANDLNRKVDFKYELADAAAAMGVVASDTFSIASSTVPTTASEFLNNKFMAEAVGTDITNATGYTADKLGITATNKMEDYVYLKTTDNKYLYVSENFYPSSSKFLKLALSTGKLATAPAVTGMTDATWKARSAFKVTYYPSVDSLVFEPLNALSANPANNAWLNGDYAFNSVNNKLSAFFNAAANAATDLQDYTNIGQVVVRIGNLTPTESVITAYNTEVTGTYNAVTNPGSLLTKFTYADRKFAYLQRATLPAGLYFIKNATTAKNLVCNFEGTMMYDAVEKYEGGEVAQNYNDMPATMWVVNTTGCTTVDVKNREYGANATAFAADPFAGQLYVDADGKYYTINKNYTGIAAKNQELNNLESYAIDAVTDNDALTSEHHGYQNLTKLNISKYNLAYNLFVNKDLFLDVTADKNFAPSDDNSAYFEAEAVTAATDVKFGAGVGVANLPQLVRTAYTLKVYDTNLIDNDKYYVYLVEETGENPYYQAMTEAEAIEKSATASVRKGVFYLKADQVKGSDKYYVLIDINEAGIKTAGLSLATDNGNVQAHCIDAVGRMSYLNLDNIASERASAFHVTSTPVALYRTIADAKTAKIFRQRGTAKEYLFEDSNNQVGAPNYVKDFGYLGLTAEGIAPAGKGSTTAMYVKYVKASDEIMPQYLFAVDTVTVKDGKWCATDEHGYIQEGDAHSDHTVPYIGYLAGRFLVNLTDSIEGKDAMLHNADKFKYSGYDRLGFVEAICRVEGGVEYLYILKGGNTLESIQAKYGVVDPATFDDATVFDKKTLDGKHANYAFSLRLINEEAEKDFLIESKGEGSAIGSFKGAWVKVQNSCPVLAKFTTTGSDHEDETGTIEELINNAQIFNIEDGLDEVATDNETINSVSTVAVVAGNGEVIVKGAEGKKVTITNVLGQTVANTVITSNEAAISTPAGVVVVAVEGEAAVKAIVK